MSPMLLTGQAPTVLNRREKSSLVTAKLFNFSTFYDQHQLHLLFKSITGNEYEDCRSFYSNECSKISLLLV